MPLVFPVLGACINRGAVPLDRGRRPRRPARTLQDADPICSRCGTKASRADQGVCPTTSAALPTVEKRVALGWQPASCAGKRAYPLGRAQLGKPMPLVFPVLGACINRGAVPLDRPTIY